MTEPADSPIAAEPAGCRIGTTGAAALPLVIEPGESSEPRWLAAWLSTNRTWLLDRMGSNGALLLRGFAVRHAVDFQAIALAVDGELKTEYLGTSPRRPVAGTTHVFSASELPPFYPIPQHAEMTFTANPPRHLFFCCLEVPATGGETPLVDLRKVYADLASGVRDRFEQGGLRIVRNYASPSGRGRFNPWQLKPWPDMFETTERATVDAKCGEQGFTTEWSRGGDLRIVSTQPVSRVHRRSGRKAWFNHSQVFHLSAGEGEYRRIFKMRPTLRHWAVWKLTAVLAGLQRWLVSSDDYAMHCTRRDGTEIPDPDMEAVRDAIWQNLSVTPWQHGDVLLIDNHAVGHGRLPYRGPRGVAAAWA